MTQQPDAMVPPTACPVPPDALTVFGAGAEAAWGFYHRTQGVHAPPDLTTWAELWEFAAGWQAAQREIARRDGKTWPESASRLD